MSITLTNISKSYGKQKALNNLDFTLQEGEICGFLGPNGAGKSTTMKIISGCLTDYQGEVNICGINLRKQPLKAKELIGYLPEHNPLYPDMYIKEYLLYVARLYHIDKPVQRVNNIVEQIGLIPEMTKRIGQLSKGYRQRVGLAQALVHDPRVLILDEPMSGLDPNQLEEIRNLIIQTGKNKTVLLSTHIMQEVEAICDRVMIIHQGKIITDKPIQEIRSLAGDETVLFIRFAPGTNTEWLSTSTAFGRVIHLTADTWQLSSAGSVEQRTALFNQAFEHHCPIIELKTEEHHLEEIFRQLTNS
ncbi:MAG: ATP-binding cassette domain-containing protein [Odoribacter sp.]